MIELDRLEIIVDGKIYPKENLGHVEMFIIPPHQAIRMVIYDKQGGASQAVLANVSYDYQNKETGILETHLLCKSCREEIAELDLIE